MIKNLMFTSHKLGMYILPFLWIFFPNLYVFYIIIILSWKINSNKCIITQLEYYFFNETFLGKGKKFNVSKSHRYILYFNTVLCLFIKLNTFL